MGASAGTGASGPGDNPPAQVLAQVLLVLRLRVVTETVDLATATGLPAGRVTQVLDVAARRELVLRRRGQLAGWGLTAAGRAEGERLLADDLDRTGTRVAVEDAYRTFVTLNPLLLESCNRWQVRTRDGARVRNDHSDPGYDALCVRSLERLHARTVPVLNRLGSRVPRYGGYLPRLDEALRRLQGGDLDWFTRPTIDSYHSVWFELHENLLATLGRDRHRETMSFQVPTAVDADRRDRR